MDPYVNYTLGQLRWVAKKDIHHYLATFHMLKYYTSTYVITTIAILGILANLIAFVVLCYQKQRLTTTVLLQCLAIIDTLILLMTVFKCVVIMAYYNRGNNTLITYYEFYKYYMGWVVLPMSYFLRLSGNWLTIQLTIDRWIAVCKPLEASRICTLARAYRNMIVIFVLSACFTIPRCLEFYGDYERSPIRGQPGNYTTTFRHLKTPMAKSKVYLVVYRIVMYSLVMYIVPMLILTILNVGLVRRLKLANEYRSQLMRQASHQSETSGMSSTNRSVTIIVMSVVGVCIVTNTIAAVAHALKTCTEIEALRENTVTRGDFNMSSYMHGQYLSLAFQYMSVFSNIMVSLNSAINFFIYCLCSRNFRSKLAGICISIKEAIVKRCHCYNGKSLNRTKSYSSNGSGHVDNTTITLYPLNTTNSLSKVTSKEEQKLLYSHSK